MSTRRDFFRQAALLSGGSALAEMLQGAIQTAAGIDPAPGSTFQDAEHVVILMQENRSFDHSFGTLRGVRGFNDPRAVTLPNGKPVWAQSNKAGEAWAPFRLNLRETKATWLGSLPHSWRDQTDARADGNHDGWLEAKPSGRPECAGKPFTMGFYNREDLPFYYALADAFTVCDQNFCSSLTGTTPNRLHLWTGTIREKAGAPANVRNSEVTYTATAKWKTFPERLEEAGVSWRVYQNEVSIDTGFEGEADDWLSNFTDNPLEWFDQYHIGFNENYLKHLATLPDRIPKELAKLDQQLAAPDLKRAELMSLQRRRRSWAAMQTRVVSELKKWSPEERAKLTPADWSLHEKAFTTNKAEPGYRELTTMTYRDGGTQRSMQVPKGDPLYQFRQDVNQGKLPTVSWLVPSSNFSDHPGSPWYGAWYLAEVMNILTKRPEVWKKTIFILTYDENDGYFDHVPPFVVPDPARPETGKVTPGIDASVEYVTLEADLKKQRPPEARGGPIGLGFRVPMVIASPWSRGGYVNSEVCDHTSVIRFLETLLSRKTGKPIRETNISAWRRAVCGDLTSTFQPFKGGAKASLPYPAYNDFLQGIHQAQFRQMPSGFKKVEGDPAGWMPQQEPGVRPACALPYDLNVDGRLSADGKSLELTLASAGSTGAPFHAYTPGRYRGGVELRTRAYAVERGQQLSDSWTLDGFAQGAYAVRVLGPNGYYREFSGSAADPQVDITCRAVKKSGDLVLTVKNRHVSQAYTVELADHGYGTAVKPLQVKAGGQASLTLKLAKSGQWYDLSATVSGATGYARRFAGRVETGKPTTSDPLMGRMPVS